ncbi:MAG TPA: nicotinate-nucleotide--dimethylbenzimidazole phosphoribosyltransferase, partial [Lachnospiraceae bacterium]|nr:nicotinate-nucleotide--dimethylbenzimidazole phosphoribosyltransferase [Lachnospiraceae bacterium]
NGIRIAQRFSQEGYQIAAAGEMGIGNTTTSTAMACVLLGKRPEEITGRGAGLSSEGLARKIRAIGKAIDINRPDASDPLDVLGKVGGFDLAGMTGFYLGCAACRLPVILDGYISCVAALAASILCPAAKEYMLVSHGSSEPGTGAVLEALGKKSPIQAGMFVGEGTGAAALLALLDMTLDVYREMSTFSEISMENYTEQN